MARRQFPLNVVDREVPLAQGDRQFADRIAGGRGVRAGEGTKEGSAFFGVVAELVAEDAETAGRVTEAPRRFVGRESLDELGAQGFVLALEGLFGGAEESGGLGFR